MLYALYRRSLASLPGLMVQLVRIRPSCRTSAALAGGNDRGGERPPFRLTQIRPWENGCVGETLKQRLVRRIRESGPMTFADFMEAALYDPTAGFYANPPIGPDRHFVTSPHVSPAFGDLLARQLVEAWELMDRPRPFTVVEIGAGDGTLAATVLQAVRIVPDLEAALRYVAVERSAGARRALEALAFEVHTSLSTVGSRIGCVIANELFDNIPFHRLRNHNGRVLEVMVATDGERLVEGEAEPSREVLSALGRPVPPGEERPVSPDSLALVHQIAATISRGYAFLFDYGFGSEDIPGPVHAYRDHQVLADVIEDPGTKDVTAAVDLDALTKKAERAGLTVWGPVSQREALLALGFRLWLSGLRSRQEEAERAGNWREANRLYGQRSKATLLIDAEQLGALQLLVFGTDGLPPPVSVLGDREKSC
jgi:SAM-dependent MidA family methyltransferase